MSILTTSSRAHDPCFCNSKVSVFPSSESVIGGPFLSSSQGSVLGPLGVVQRKVVVGRGCCGPLEKCKEGSLKGQLASGHSPSRMGWGESCAHG